MKATFNKPAICASVCFILANCAQGPAEKLAEAASDASFAYAAELGRLEKSLQTASDRRVEAIARLDGAIAANRAAFEENYVLNAAYGANGRDKAKAFDVIRETALSVAASEQEARTAAAELRARVESDLEKTSADRKRVGELAASLQGLTKPVTGADNFKAIVKVITTAAGQLKRVAEDGEAAANSVAEEAASSANDVAATGAGGA